MQNIDLEKRKKNIQMEEKVEKIFKRIPELSLDYIKCHRRSDGVDFFF